MSDFRIQGVIDADAKRFQAAIAGVLKSFGDLRGAQDKTAVSSRLLERQTRDLNQALERQNAQVGALVLNYRALRNAMLGLSLTFAIAGFRGLTATVGALGAGLVELGAQAAQLSIGMGVLASAGMAAVAQGALVAVIGLKGVSKAMTTTGTDHEKAMAKLTAPARAFVGQLHDMQTAFREIKLLAQQGLFAGIVKGVKAAMPVLGAVKQVVFDTATAMGYLADRVGTLIGQRAGDLKAFGERNVVTLRRMGDAAINLGDAFLQIMRAADPFIGHVTAGLVTLSKTIEGAAIKARKDGSLGSFFFDLQKSWDLWTSTFGAVATGLVHIFTAASGPSNSVAAAIHKAAEDFKAWTGSTSGQDKMKRFFTESNTVLGSMAKFAGALVKDLAGLAVGGGGDAVAFFDTLRKHVLPTLNDLAQRLSSDLFPNLLKFTGAISDFIRAALPGLNPVTNALGFLVTQLTGLLKVTTPLIAQMPGITKLVAAFVIGGGVLGAWSKLTDLIGLAFLRAKMFVGLAPEMAGFGSVAQSILLRGGRNQAAGQAGLVQTGRAGGVGAVTASGGGGGGVARGGGSRGGLQTIAPFSGFRFATAQDAENLLRWNREAERAGRAVEGLGRVAKANAGPINAITGLGQGVGVVHSPQGDRVNGQFARVPGTPTPTAPSTARARLDAQSFDLTGKGKLTALADNIGGATHAGVIKGMAMAKPVLGAVFATMAFSGILSGITSHAKTIGGRLQDILSGATFGAIKSTADSQAAHANTLARQVKSGTIDVQGLGKQFDIGTALRKGGLNPKLLQAKFTIDTKQGVEALRNIVESLRKTGQISDQVASTFAQAGRKMAAGLEAANVKEWTAQVKHNWASMASDSQGRLSDIRKTVALNTTIIKQRLGGDTAAGKKALSDNFKQAADAIDRAMKRGTVSVSTGTKAIHDAMVSALSQLGFTQSQADKKAGSGLRNGQVQQTPGQRQPGQNSPGGAARGALQTIPGQPGRDSVPLEVGGRKIIAAPGEDVAVINRHQRKVLDQRTADMGGLAGVFRNVTTPHSQNDVRSFAGGGLASQGGGALAQMINAANSIDSRHMPYKWGGGHNAGFSGPYDCSGAWSAILHAAGLLDAPETSGQFASYGLPGPGTVSLYANASHVYGSIMGKFFGTSGANPGGGAGWFPGGPRSGFTVRHVPEQLLKGAGNLAGMIGGGIPGVGPMLKRVLAKDGGQIGDLEQTALDRVQGAAQSRVDAAAAQSLGGMGGGSFGGGDSAEGATPNAAAKLAKDMAAQMFGWTGGAWNALSKLGTRESGWSTTALNPSSGAFGIGQFLGATKAAYAKFGATSHNAGQQINAMLHYIKDRYGSPIAAWAHEQSAGWYEQGGMVETLFASAGQPPVPPRGGGTPNVDPGAAVTPGSRGGNDSKGKPKPKPKAKKKKKPPKPFAAHHPVPNTAGIKGDKPKAKARKKNKDKEFYPGLHGGSDVAEAELAKVLPNYDALFETPINTGQSLLTNLAGRADLTDEQAVVSLFDSGSYEDLTAFWAAHPDLAKTYQGQLDSFDIVNVGGQTVQGVFTPGINQHVGELLAQMQLHTGSADAAGQGGLVGTLNRYVGALSGKGMPATTKLRAKAISELKRLKTHWEMWQGRRGHDNAELAKLGSGGRSWEQRVSDNKARVKVLQDYKRQVHTDAVGHRLTEADKKNLTKATQEIADINSDSEHLRSTKPAPAFAHEKKADRAHRLSRMAHLKQDRDDALLRMDELAASRDKWNTDGGLAKDWTDRISTYSTSLTDQGSKLTDLQLNRLPAEQLTVAQIGKEIGDWQGTIVPLPKIDATATTDQQQAIADLLKQQNDQLLQELAVSQSEKAIFEGFAPLLAKNLVGVFERGGVVPRTGLALVHENETITPDPRGPYGNSITQGRGGDTSMSVHLAGDLAPLLRLVDARINDVAPKLVDRRLGRDGRSLHFAPGR